ncbi:ribonuclease H-like domain-containing protein [Tanacetum coccineum]
MMERELGEGYSFIKKKCFVCGSLSHLIRDCDFYEKKMAREAELKKQRVFNTGNGVAKPVWNNANRVNHANHFVPRPVQLNAVRPNSNSVRPNVNTGRANVNSVRQNVNSVRSNVNTVRPKQPVPTSNSNSFSPVRPQGTVVKTSACYNWRNTRPNSNCNSGSNFVQAVNAKGPQGRPKPEKAWDELELSETLKNRIAQVQEAAKYYTEENWDLVRAKLEANRDLSSKVLSIDFSSDDFAKKMVELINEKKRLYKEQREREIEETDL